MADTMVIAGIELAGAAAAAVVISIWSRMSEYRRAFRKAGPVEEYSPDRYQPMVRLFNGADSDFLGQHVKCPKLTARWQRAQRRIARLYLNELAADFQGLHRQARILIAQSPEQYADLIPVLFRQQAVFWRTLLWIELRLAFNGLGLPGFSKFNPELLIAPLEAIRRETTRASALA